MGEQAAPRNIYLVDGSNHAFRVFFALPRMSADGFPTGALLGFANLLRWLEQHRHPDHVVVVFDKGPSWRVDLYPDYKGHRPEMDPELRRQWPHLPELVEAWGYRTLAVEGVEADDVMGTLARRWAGPDTHVWLVTGDKDMHQLVGEHVTVLDVMKDREIGPEEVRERWGVPPDKVVDVLALAGDSSDNVPGVRGIGPKTAARLVQRYGGLDAVLDHAAEVGGKRGRALVEERDRALLSRELVRIRTDVPLDLEIADLQAHPRDTDRLRELFRRWQFRTHMRALEEEVGGGSAVDASGYRAVTDLEALREAVGAARAAGRVALDLETTSLDPLRARVVGVSLCWSEAEAVYVPVGHVDEAGGRLPGQLDWAEVRAVLDPLLADPAVAKTGQNLKYDLSVLRVDRVRGLAGRWDADRLAGLGPVLEGLDGDTMLADYLLEPERNGHGLDDLALRYLGHRMVSYEEVAGRDGAFERVDLEAATRYAAEDAHVAFLLDRQLGARLEADADLARLYREVELPLVEVLSEMELRGIGLDVDRLRALGAELQERIDAAVARCHELAGHPFNVQSTPQLRRVLFEEMGLKPLRRTRTGPSTDAETLAHLAEQGHELPRAILEVRALAKLKGTYVDALPRAVSPVDGRVHTSFHQAVAATGRLASNDPNLQNIPVRTEDGRRIRACFVPREGHLFLSCDYSQVELRVLAHLCGSGPLVEAFRRGEDVHRRTAAEVFGVPPEQVTPGQRRAAKAVIFGILYGIGPARLARELGLSRGEAADLIDRTFARYPQVREVLDRLVEQARATGVARTLWGRRRPIADLGSRNPRARAAAERVAVNTPIQGTAADVIKRAMIRVQRRLRAEAPGAALLLQVHDELLLEVPAGEVERVAGLVREEMEGAAELAVPLVVDVGWGANWAEAH